MADSDPTSLHDLAVDAQTDIQKLAVGLAHAGASPQAVDELNKMSQTLGSISKVLNQAPHVEQAAQQGPPPGAPGLPPGAPPPGPQGAPGPGGPPGLPAGPPHVDAMHHATTQLHQAMVASAQRRQQP